MRIVLLYLLVAVMLWGCKKSTNTKPFEPKFVVEGWIENGDYPVVILTHNLPIDAVIDSAQIEEVVIRWAKVEVQTDDESEILTLVRDDEIFPHYIYKGAQLKGKTGKRYKLIITYAGNTITAETSVPNTPVIDSIGFMSVDNNKYQLTLSFTDDAATADFYRFYAKLDTETLFNSTNPGGFSDRSFNGRSVSFQLYRNRYSNVSPYQNAYYNKDNRVNVKLSKMDSTSFAYWESVDREISRIPFLSKTGIAGSNIMGPATGIWYGVSSHVATGIAK